MKPTIRGKDKVFTESPPTIRIDVSKDPKGHPGSMWIEYDTYSRITEAEMDIEKALEKYPSAKIVMEHLYRRA